MKKTFVCQDLILGIVQLAETGADEDDDDDNGADDD